jgi:flavin-dependent dehydrogenase
MSTTPNTPSEQNDKVEEYDLVILGSGTGGTVAAWTFAGKHRMFAEQERHSQCKSRLLLSPK